METVGGGSTGVLLPTTCISGADAALLKAVSPPYVAVIVCDPVLNEPVEMVAIPLIMVPVPRMVLPSSNVIEPVAAAGTVDVNTTLCPGCEGVADVVSVTVGVILLTVTIVAGEVAAL